MSTIEKKSVKVGKYVSTEHVDSLIRNYKKERWLQNSEKLGKADNLGVWYSAEELEEFIQTARRHGADGIRICFGVYGDDNAPKPGMEGSQTVAFVATVSTDENSDKPVYKDLYLNRNGKPSLVAYNATPWPFTSGHGETDGGLGALIVTNKDNGLTVI